MTSTPPPLALSPLSGVDRLLADDQTLEALRSRRVALLTNAACRTADGTPTAEALNAALGQPSKPGLARLFAPEHGAGADHAAGAFVADQRGAAGATEVISLYGDRRVPAPEHLAAIDTLIIDLRDVGVRCYTYATSAALAAKAALDAGLDVIISNRLNPLGTVTCGPTLDTRLRSFLAYFDVPFVHGKTIGDLVVGAFGDHPRVANLAVMAPPPGAATPELPWIPPSPSLQTPDAVQFYPGLVLFEGTNLCEGRGTPLPFRCIGAPWLNAIAAAAAVNGWPTGITATPCEIQPDSGEHASQTLPAVRFDRSSTVCDGFGLGVRLLAWISATHRDFEWRAAPVLALEPQPDRPAQDRFVVDTLLGSDSLRTALARGEPAEDILARWRD